MRIGKSLVETEWSFKSSGFKLTPLLVIADVQLFLSLSLSFFLFLSLSLSLFFSLSFSLYLCVSQVLLLIACLQWLCSNCDLCSEFLRSFILPLEPEELMYSHR